MPASPIASLGAAGFLVLSVLAVPASANAEAPATAPAAHVQACDRAGLVPAQDMVLASTQTVEASQAGHDLRASLSVYTDAAATQLCIVSDAQGAPVRAKRMSRAQRKDTTISHHVNTDLDVAGTMTLTDTGEVIPSGEGLDAASTSSGKASSSSAKASPPAVVEALALPITTTSVPFDDTPEIRDFLPETLRPFIGREVTSSLSGGQVAAAWTMTAWMDAPDARTGIKQARKRSTRLVRVAKARYRTAVGAADAAFARAQASGNALQISLTEAATDSARTAARSALESEKAQARSIVKQARRGRAVSVPYSVELRANFTLPTIS